MDIKQWLRKGEEDNIFLIKDIATHGCSGAVNGIIYYYETTKFHADHEKEIWDLLYEHAQQEGEQLIDKVAQVCKGIGSHAQFVNALVWWAVEVRAQELLVEQEAA